MATLKQNTPYPRLFYMVQSSDHISPLTGATPVLQICKAAAANPPVLSTPVGTAQEVGSGFYVLDLAAADTNTLGDLGYNITATGGDPTCFTDQITANILGDTLPANVTEIAGNAVTASGGIMAVNATQWDGASVGSVSPDAVFLHSGTAQGGASGSITLDSGASATNNLYNNCVVFIRSGAGVGQANIITGYVGSTKVATVNTAWAVNPDSTSVFTVAAFGPSLTAFTGTVNANVTQVNGSSVAATNIGISGQVTGRGTCTAGGSATTIPTSAWSLGGSGVVQNQFAGRVIVFDANTITAALQGQATTITGNTASPTPTFTVALTALTTAPAVGDTFSVF